MRPHCITAMFSPSTRRLMQRASFAFSTTVALTAGTLCPAAATTCIKNRLIENTKVIDANTLDFHMKDGTIYRSFTRSSCSGLIFSGFVHRSYNDEICEHETIRILQSHEICSLGTFTKQPPASKAGQK
jgi:hypothetical protein